MIYTSLFQSAHLEHSSTRTAVFGSIVHVDVRLNMMQTIANHLRIQTFLYYEDRDTAWAMLHQRRKPLGFTPKRNILGTLQAFLYV